MNHRFLKVSLNLPSALSLLSADVDRLVRDAVGRGAVTMIVHLVDDTGGARYRIVPGAVEEYQREAARLYRAAGAEPPAAEKILPLVLALPGAVEPIEIEGAVDEATRGLVVGVVREALEDLTRAREAEGTHLRDVLAAHADRVERLKRRIEERAPAVPVEQRDRLLGRVQRLLGELNPAAPILETDLLREICLLADRLDVTEELKRLHGHLVRFRAILEEGAESGRRLEFLLQEMHRETNTLGSKAGDGELSLSVVELKVELERMREQVQNLE